MIRDRCEGSLQLVAAWSPHARRAPCPVCGQLVEQVPLNGTPALVEHRARQTEALPISLDLFGV